MDCAVGHAEVIETGSRVESSLFCFEAQSKAARPTKTNTKTTNVYDFGVPEFLKLDPTTSLRSHLC